MHSLQSLANKTLGLALHKANKTEEKALEAVDQLWNQRHLGWYLQPELLRTAALWRQSEETHNRLTDLDSVIMLLSAQVAQKFSQGVNSEDEELLALREDLLNALTEYQRSRSEYDELVQHGFAWHEKL